MKKSSGIVAAGGIIAAAYIALTLLSAAIGLSSGIVQIRLAEALCILPVFSPASIPGLFIGCLLANVLTGANILDVICGSLATLIGAFLTYKLRKHRFLAVLPPILANTFVLPFIFVYVYHLSGGYWYFAAIICIGEFISCGLLGQLLYQLLKPYRDILRY